VTGEKKAEEEEQEEQEEEQEERRQRRSCVTNSKRELPSTSDAVLVGRDCSEPTIIRQKAGSVCCVGKSSVEHPDEQARVLGLGGGS
jgi:hypothetical protein